MLQGQNPGKHQKAQPEARVVLVGYREEGGGSNGKIVAGDKHDTEGSISDRSAGPRDVRRISTVRVVVLSHRKRVKPPGV